MVINHLGKELRVNRREGRVYLTMSDSDKSVTMALPPEEALTLGTYLQVNAQAIISSMGAVIGSKRGRDSSAKAATAPRQRESEEVGIGDEDVSEE